jgi:hypothetical protein
MHFEVNKKVIHRLHEFLDQYLLFVEEDLVYHKLFYSIMYQGSKFFVFIF